MVAAMEETAGSAGDRIEAWPNVRPHQKQGIRHRSSRRKAARVWDLAEAPGFEMNPGARA